MTAIMHSCIQKKFTNNRLKSKETDKLSSLMTITYIPTEQTKSALNKHPNILEARTKYYL
jgi:hypothetical protein